MVPSKTNPFASNLGEGIKPPLNCIEKAAFVFHPAIAPMLIVLVGIVFLYPLWTSSQIVYSKHSDFIAQFLSIKSIGVQALKKEGSFPLWNPSMNAGAPAFANPESEYIFPFDLLFLILPIAIATNLTILLKVLLAGLAMYLFSRQFFKYSGSALFCAVAYMLSYRYIALIHAGWITAMTMYALTPLIFWALEKLLRKPTMRTIALLSIVLALALIQGDMQQLYYTGMACIIYTIIRLMSITRQNKLRVCTYLFIGGMLGVTLAAPGFLPRLQYASLSTRPEDSYEFFLDKAPTLIDLETFLNPNDRGGERHEFWEKNFYFGFWLLPLWFFALEGSLRRSTLLLMAGLIMIFLCFDSIILRYCYRFVPAFKLFRQPPRVLFLAQFVLLLVAGIAIDTILSSNTERQKMRKFSMAAAVTAAAGLVAAIKLQTNPLYSISVLLAIIALLGFIRRQAKSAIVALLCLLPILDSTIRVHPMIQTKPLSTAAPKHPIHELLNRNVTNGRTIAVGRTSIPYGLAGYYKIDMVNGYSPMTLRHYIEYFKVLQFGLNHKISRGPVVWTDFVRLSKPHMLYALDVHYIVANQDLPLGKLGYKKIGRYKNVPIFVFYHGISSFPVDIWHLENPLGPAYFAKSVHGVENESQSLEAIGGATSALEAHVMGLDRDIPKMDSTGSIVKMIYRGINRYEYQIETKFENFLILSQVWYPGWTATLDSKKIKVYRTNHALIGCFIRPGQHCLILEMTCPLLKYGIMMAMAAMLIIIILFIGAWWKTKIS